MDADTQSIAVLVIDSSIPMKLITDPIAIKMIVRIMKKVRDAFSAVLYVLGTILRGRIILERSSLMRK